MSSLEDLFAFQVRAVKLPRPERELRFCEDRRWRMDFAWPRERIAVEIQGGIWTSGRHVTGIGAERDMEKHNAAVLAGWTLLYLSPGMVRSGEGLRALQLLLEQADEKRKRDHDLSTAED